MIRGLTMRVRTGPKGIECYAVDIGAGRYVPRDDQLVDAVAELAEPGSEALATMRAAVKAAARPDATRRIAELIASMSGGSA